MKSKGDQSMSKFLSTSFLTAIFVTSLQAEDAGDIFQMLRDQRVGSEHQASTSESLRTDPIRIEPVRTIEPIRTAELYAIIWRSWQITHDDGTVEAFSEDLCEVKQDILVFAPSDYALPAPSVAAETASPDCKLEVLLEGETNKRELFVKLDGQILQSNAFQQQGLITKHVIPSWQGWTKTEDGSEAHLWYNHSVVMAAGESVDYVASSLETGSSFTWPLADRGELVMTFYVVDEGK